MTIEGRVWKFGDNVSTDLMLPGSIVYAVMNGKMSAEESIPYCMSANRPDWHRQVRPGDIVVAGSNFGVGSARPAFAPLKAMGIAAVVADSISRLFYRASINGGLLAIPCPGVSALVEEGDTIVIDQAAGEVRTRNGARLPFPPLPPDSPPMRILKAGGLIPYMKARLGLEQA